MIDLLEHRIKKDAFIGVEHELEAAFGFISGGG